MTDLDHQGSGWPTAASAQVCLPARDEDLRLAVAGLAGRGARRPWRGWAAATQGTHWRFPPSGITTRRCSPFWRCMAHPDFRAESGSIGRWIIGSSRSLVICFCWRAGSLASTDSSASLSSRSAEVCGPPLPRLSDRAVEFVVVRRASARAARSWPAPHRRSVVEGGGLFMMRKKHATGQVIITAHSAVVSAWRGQRPAAAAVDTRWWMAELPDASQPLPGYSSCNDTRPPTSPRNAVDPATSSPLVEYYRPDVDAAFLGWHFLGVAG